MTFKTIERKEKRIQNLNKIIQELRNRYRAIGELIDLYECELEDCYTAEITADLLTKAGILDLSETRS